MDRVIVYPAAIPLETDILQSNKNAMIGLGKLAEAVIGSAQVFRGLTVAPTSPASLQVMVNPGEIYAQSSIDATAYSTLAADTTHNLVKQGVMLDPTALTLTAPGTSGQSINYLIQARFQEVDGGATVLPYYNAANPSQGFSGPNNTGISQNTLRQGTVSVMAKPGVSATTGAQTTPTVDSGYVPLAAVTVANGQTQINSGNISAVSTSAIGETLQNKIGLTTGDARYLQIVNAFAAGNSSWNEVSSSRSIGVNYTNSRTRPIFVSVSALNTVDNSTVQLNLIASGQPVATTTFISGTVGQTQILVNGIVPANASYSISGTQIAISRWTEYV